MRTPQVYAVHARELEKLDERLIVHDAKQRPPDYLRNAAVLVMEDALHGYRDRLEQLRKVLKKNSQKIDRGMFPPVEERRPANEATLLIMAINDLLDAVGLLERQEVRAPRRAAPENRR